MKLAKYRDQTGEIRVGAVESGRLKPLRRGTTLSAILSSERPKEATEAALESGAESIDFDRATILAPIDEQEVWGAGVTYQRSKEAREEESDQAATFYDQVYRADRPELFFKAMSSRVVGPNGAIRVRGDSTWSVPEPELALVLTKDLKLVGYTIGNDVSARDIEGRNPLYLPQAKVYDACCALGPVIVLADELPASETIGIRLTIDRDGSKAFEGATTAAKMARSFAELIDWLGRENVFPNGAILLTGTGIVPPDDFTLKNGDQVRIEIDGVGTLVNSVIQAKGKGD